jgi:hypothetical protein
MAFKSILGLEEKPSKHYLLGTVSYRWRIVSCIAIPGDSDRRLGQALAAKRKMAHINLGVPHVPHVPDEVLGRSCEVTDEVKWARPADPLLDRRVHQPIISGPDEGTRH